MIYLDSAAIVKMVRVEAESKALITWLNEHKREPLVASALVEVEVPRALRRSQPGVLAGVASALARLHRIAISSAVRATAASYTDDSLRSLDVIHLATVELLVASEKHLTGFVTYDRRLLVAAENIGLPCAAPGVT